ncbi:hypothetical protein BDZ91DRAFT_709852 [Kalaharituber pfeilii]|nr:hypothetical protein BDZ91DRAFT_709852 [Kalaharituber pfeilii]
MSSIFSFDPSPPHPASPWGSNSRNNTPLSSYTRPGSSLLASNDSLSSEVGSGKDATNKGAKIEGNGLVGVKGLISEPQVGSTEYKLHLLKEGKSLVRLEQLTTQLLWRLQQSNPYFSAASSGPSSNPQQIRDSLQDSQGALYELGVCDDGTFVGLLEEELEESLDTLREMAARLGCTIWVLRRIPVGKITAEDAARNVSESSRAGEWDDREDMGRRRGNRTGTLWVAEAFVKPMLKGVNGGPCTGDSSSGGATEDLVTVKENIIPPATEQLKISLTGTTTSGKSTLLGSLTTSQPDNGRGKSRLSLFRHRHELVSGVTSSVAQEIVGYKPYSTQDLPGGEVINYSYGNISSWIDVHTAISNTRTLPNADCNGRIVFFSDTAGHPRYRRTTIRSLVGWAPHYALLLIPADEDELTDATKKHLQLVLKLGLRLVVLLTKLDIARKEGLRRILSEVLSSLRKHGREPVTMSSSAKTFGTWGVKEEGQVRDVIRKIEALDEMKIGEGKRVVPIVFTSSVTGQGIGCLHALLRGLPIPKEETKECRKSVNQGANGNVGLMPIEGSSLVEVIEELGKVLITGKTVDDDVPMQDGKVMPDSGKHDNQQQPIETLFHIEEVFALPDSYTFFPDIVNADSSGVAPDKAYEGAIVSGHVRYGRISVGDVLVVGPFSARPPTEATSAGMRRSQSTGSIPTQNGRKGSTVLSPTTISLLLVSSAGAFGGRKGWLSDEEGTGVSSGDENHRPKRPNSGTPAMTKGGNGKGSGNNSDNDESGQLQLEEWKVARVVSVRRLRLPVGTLFEGEAGTLGLVCLGTLESLADLEESEVVGTGKGDQMPKINVENLLDGDVDTEEGGVSLTEIGAEGPLRIASPGRTDDHLKKESKVQETSGIDMPIAAMSRTVSFATPDESNGNNRVQEDSGGGNGTKNGTVEKVEFRLRKGMVILNRIVSGRKGVREWPKAYSGFVTEFERWDNGGEGGGGGVTSLAVGSHVVIYCASIRAAARIIELPVEYAAEGSGWGAGFPRSLRGSDGGIDRKKKGKVVPEEVDLFGFDVDEGIGSDGEDGKEGEQAEVAEKMICAFEFLRGSEWVEVGAKVLVTSGQGRGLDGVVGRVVMGL